jgi:Uma2 family endonuclease
MSAAPVIRSVDEEELKSSPSEEIVLRGIRLPVTIRPRSPLSDEELLSFCAANDGRDIECDSDGSIRVMTPAKSKTSLLNALLVTELLAWSRRTSKGVAFGPDHGIRFADRTLRAPDASWLSAERWGQAQEQEKTNPGFLHFCPEFIAELRSHSDRASAIEAKMEFWMSRGAQLGWLIDPMRKLAMIYRPGQEPETLLKPEFLQGEGPLEGFRLEMKDFWT